MKIVYQDKKFDQSFGMFVCVATSTFLKNTEIYTTLFIIV